MAQRALAVGKKAAIVGIGREVARLLRIGREIEALRRHADIIYVFKRPLADQKGAGRRTRSMALGQHCAAGCRGRTCLSAFGRNSTFCPMPLPIVPIALVQCISWP